MTTVVMEPPKETTSSVDKPKEAASQEGLDIRAMQQRAIGVYRQLVLAIADGKTPDDETIRRTCGDAARRLGQLEADVATVKRMHESKEDIKRADEIEKGLGPIRQQFQSALLKLQAVEREAETAVARARDQAGVLEDEIRTQHRESQNLRQSARRMLVESTDSEEIAKRIGCLEQKAVALGDAVNRGRHAAQELVVRKEKLQQLEQFGPSEELQNAQDAAFRRARLKREGKQAAKELTQVQAQLEDLYKQRFRPELFKLAK